MNLLPKSLEKLLPPLYSQEDIPDPMVYAKFFDPCGSWTWLATEYDPARRLFFGLVKGLEEELGCFSLDELRKYKNRLGIGIERDINFTPCLLSVARRTA